MGAEQLLNKEFDDISQDLQQRVGGKADSLRNTVLSFVAKDKFDLAVRELRYYQQFVGDYAVFVERTERLFDHCEELIMAIKAKKSFPNLDALPMGKRQEILERVHEHFDDLQNHLKRIEQLENDIRVQDARSTVWVVQSFIVSGFVLVIFSVVLEAMRTLGLSFNVVVDDVAELFFKVFGL